MFRLVLKLGLAAAAGWAVWSYAPIGGRTLAQRWRASGDLATFVERGWAEATGAPERVPPKPQARPRPKPAQRDRPAEQHTDADRRAIERILADNLAERP